MTTVLWQRPEMFPRYLLNDMTAKPNSWSPEPWPLPAVSGDAQSNFSSFLFRDVRRTIKKERSVDNGELVKPHLDWLSFSPTSFPHSMPACWLGNAGQRLPAFPFSAGEDFPLQRLSSGPATSWGHAWGNGWETPRAENYLRRRFVLAGFLEVMMGRTEDAGYHLIRGFEQIN